MAAADSYWNVVELKWAAATCAHHDTGMWVKDI